VADRTQSLYREVYRTLRGRILSGAYELGAQIETEQRLTQQCGASIITIRQAEQMLVDEGLLDKQQGRGTFVPESVRRHLRVLCVCGLDLAQGLQHHMGPYYSGLITLSRDEAARRGQHRRAPQVYIPGAERRFSFEAAGYLRTLELDQAGTDLSRIALLDDVVAQGVTRALLKTGRGERDVKLSIVCGRQEIIPLGFRATYIVAGRNAIVTD
jgi:hypothetical protein